LPRKPILPGVINLLRRKEIDVFFKLPLDELNKATMGTGIYLPLAGIVREKMKNRGEAGIKPGSEEEKKWE
jgi:hypothetical protein